MCYVPLVACVFVSILLGGQQEAVSSPKNLPGPPKSSPLKNSEQFFNTYRVII